MPAAPDAYRALGATATDAGHGHLQRAALEPRPIDVRQKACKRRLCPAYARRMPGVSRCGLRFGQRMPPPAPPLAVLNGCWFQRTHCK